MVISKLLKSTNINKHKELVQELQQKARMLFYDKMMYEVNDALTSILASIDVEGRDSIPKIKQYIHRINQSLSNTKNYQSNFNSEKKFNISIVLDNLIKVIRDTNKETKLACLVADIKAPVSGDQTKFETLFLHIFVSMLLHNQNPDSEILIELRQKDQDAMLTILKDAHKFTDEEKELINKVKEEDGFVGDVLITPHGRGVEIIIKIPLQFKVINISKPIKRDRNTAQKARIKKGTGSKKIVVNKSYSNSNTEAIFPRFAY